jgi:hypothetical protein
MAKDLTVVLENRPGTLADMAAALGRADINIDGLCGFVHQDQGVFHVLVEDAISARRALEEEGFKVSGEREVLVMEIEDRPGILGDLAKKIAAAGVNIELSYLAADSRLVMGCDDLDKARAAVT